MYGSCAARVGRVKHAAMWWKREKRSATKAQVHRCRSGDLLGHMHAGPDGVAANDARPSSWLRPIARASSHPDNQTIRQSDPDQNARLWGKPV